MYKSVQRITGIFTRYRTTMDPPMHNFPSELFSIFLWALPSYQILNVGVQICSPREGNGTPLQYSCLENPMDRRAWQVAVHGVTKSGTRVTSLSLFTFMHWRRKWQPTPVFLPGESQGRGSLVGCRLWGHTELDTTEATQQQQQICNLGKRS